MDVVLELMHLRCELLVMILFAIFARALHTGWVTSSPSRPRSLLIQDRMLRACRCASKISGFLDDGVDEVTLWFLAERIAGHSGSGMM